MNKNNSLNPSTCLSIYISDSLIPHHLLNVRLSYNSAWDYVVDDMLRTISVQCLSLSNPHSCPGLLNTLSACLLWPARWTVTWHFHLNSSPFIARSPLQNIYVMTNSQQNLNPFFSTFHRSGENHLRKCKTARTWQKDCTPELWPHLCGCPPWYTCTRWPEVPMRCSMAAVTRPCVPDSKIAKLPPGWMLQWHKSWDSVSIRRFLERERK